MIRSMTGYGRGEVLKGGKSFSVEIKTLNHRFSDISIKIPKQISFLEERVRETVNREISRGKIEVCIVYEDAGEKERNIRLDESLAETYIKALEIIRDKFNVKDDITVSLVAKFPDVIKIEDAEEDEEELWTLLKEALGTAIEAVIKMRENEGKKLEDSLLSKLELIEGKLNEIKKRAPEVVKEYKRKLESRIKELLEQNLPDESRLAMEVALFADKCSIDEEIVRLESHIDQMNDLLEKGSPVGKKLDFLIQEMNREVNTIGAKASDLDITRCVVELKSEIEKLREQVQNIE